MRRKKQVHSEFPKDWVENFHGKNLRNLMNEERFVGQAALMWFVPWLHMVVGIITKIGF